MKYSVLAGRDNFQEVILEEKYNFILAILEELEIDVSEVLTNTNPDVFERRKLKEYLYKYQVYISFNGDDSLEIYFHDGKIPQLLAQWKKPFYIIKKDLSQIDPAKKTYVEIYFEFESIFDEENSNG